jgi:8-oxo-dGTP diphosphatase
MITYRKAAADDVRPALDLVLNMFVKFQMPDYEPQALEYFKAARTENENYIGDYEAGKNMMFIALDGEKIVGMINEHGNNRHISEMAVDGAYHRRGIATELMNRMVCTLKLQGVDKISLTASPYGLPFYLNYGFKPIDIVQRPKTGFVFTPMEYTPNEIWDVLDEYGNKTGRYAERGRKMAAGDYHLVVHVWKHNSKGEWLIDKRTIRGTSMDGKWETTGGAAIAGDDSLTAALREAKEELGLDLGPKKGLLFRRTAQHGNDGHSWLQDAWVFEHDCSIEAVRFQESETCDAMWATTDKIREMMAAGEFLSEWFYPYFEEMAERWRLL